MAAAEYYNPGGGQQFPGPPPPPQQAPGNSNNLLPYPLSDAPPPYTPYANQPRPHSQPPPHQRPAGDAYRPAPPNGYQQPPPEKSSRPQQVRFGSSQVNLQQPYQQQPPPPPQQQQSYFSPLAGTPAMQQVHNNPAATARPAQQPALYRDERTRSRSRSRSRDQRKHHSHHHHSNRPHMQRKKSSGVNTFLGAGGGALIGDAIFPGLGTLGGAILGGLGGHEYGKKRAHSTPSSRGRGRSYSNDGGSEMYYNDEYRRGRGKY